MFEYLMPLLFTRSSSNSLLEQACRDAVERQIEYGNEQRDAMGHFRIGLERARCQPDYQYRAFGVPALALNPGTEERTGGGALFDRARPAGGSGGRDRQSASG